jgi:hypothetical protein
MKKITKIIYCQFSLFQLFHGVGCDVDLNSAKIMALRDASQNFNEAAKELGNKTIKRMSPYFKELLAKHPEFGSNTGLEALKAAIPVINENVDKLSKTDIFITSRNLQALERLAQVLKTAQPALENDGIEAAKVLAPMIEKSSGDVKQACIALAAAAPNTGANVGVGTLNTLGAAIKTTGAAIKSAGSTVTAVAVAHPVATCIVIGGVVVGVVVYYKGREIYRHFFPTEAQKANDLQEKLRAIKYKAKLEKIEKEMQFKHVLIQNASSAAKTATGIPVAAQSAAQQLAAVAGQKKVDKIVASYNKYAPQAALA